LFHRHELDYHPHALCPRARLAEQVPPNGLRQDQPVLGRGRESLAERENNRNLNN